MTQAAEYEVKAGFETLDAARVAGISVVTDNENGAEAINGLWERFEQQVGQALEDARENDFIYAIYSDYEGDHTQPYRFTLGHKLKEEAEAPADFHVVDIRPGLCDVAARGAAQGVGPVWTSVWQSDLDRRYITDFEVYGPRFFEEGLHEVLICVGVNNDAGIILLCCQGIRIYLIRLLGFRGAIS